MNTDETKNVTPHGSSARLASRAKKKPTKNKIIQQLIGIAHELDWAYFWKDAERHKIAIAALEEVKATVGWHDR